MLIFIEPDPALWTGRFDGNDPLAFRFYQKIQCIPVDRIPFSPEEKQIVFLGFSSDEGVRRNKGRPGARKGPDEIRKQLAGLPYPLEEAITLYDGGNIMVDGDLEKGQEELGQAVKMVLTGKAFPLIFGGGHETAYGHYLGVRGFLGKEPSLGIINIDAHFDMREDWLSTSGTMFRQILEQDSKAGYLVLGIQPLGNTKKLFSTAKRFGAKYFLEEELEENYEEVLVQILDFTKKYDYLLLTLCFDSINSAYAPGVSAPSPFGLNPKTVRSLLRLFGKMEHLLSFDISEVNPETDENGKTSKLAAMLAAELLMARFS